MVIVIVIGCVLGYATIGVVLAGLACRDDAPEWLAERMHLPPWEGDGIDGVSVGFVVAGWGLIVAIGVPIAAIAVPLWLLGRHIATWQPARIRQQRHIEDLERDLGYRR